MSEPTPTPQTDDEETHPISIGDDATTETNGADDAEKEEKA